MMRLSGEVVIKFESDSLYIKVVPFALEGITAVVFFGFLASWSLAQMIDGGFKIGLMFIPMVGFLIICMSPLFTKKELWFSSSGIQVRKKTGLLSHESKRMPLVSPIVEYRTAPKSGGGYTMVMTYPHSGEKVTFFEGMGLSEQKAQEICHAVERYISGKPINDMNHK